MHTDTEIKDHLRALADTLGLPQDAHAIFVKRKADHILLWNEYYYHVSHPSIPGISISIRRPRATSDGHGAAVGCSDPVAC